MNGEKNEGRKGNGYLVLMWNVFVVPVCSKSWMSEAKMAENTSRSENQVLKNLMFSEFSG